MGKGEGLFGILDGHGGSDVSEFCKETFPNVVKYNISGFLGRN